MIRLAATVAGLMLLAFPAMARPATPNELLAIARRVVSREGDLSQLWPGFWPPGQPFILHDPATGSVFGGGAAPGGPEYRPGPLPGAHSAYELDYPSGAPNTVALRYQAGAANLDTLFHEQFHDYQSEGFRWRGGGTDEFVDPFLIPDKAAFAAAAEIERRVLARALSARRPAERRRLAGQYLALRRYRLGGLDAAVADAEAHREWSEGVAEYVGLRGAAIVAGRPDDARRRIVQGLRKDLNAAGGGFSTSWFRWRAYGVGAAIAWLLDDLGVDWRPAVEDGARLDEVLAQAIGQAGTERHPGDLLARYQFGRLRREMADRLRDAPHAPSTREEFLASAPIRLVIEVIVPQGRLGEVETSFQADGMTSLPDGLLALTEVGYFVVRFEEIDLRISDRPVLAEFRSDAPRHVVLLSSFDGLTDLVEAPSGNLEPAGLHLDLDWIHLRAPHATIERDGNELRLRLMSQRPDGT